MAQRDVPEPLRRRIAELPDGPGVYFFKDRDGAPVYIGKALSLKKRVRGHFAHFGESGSKEGLILAQTRRIDHIVTATEAEALLLEASLVRELMPRYNSELKDDKSYPFLKITAEEFPRLLIVRGRKADGGRYFGPYTDAGALKQAVEFLRRQFPMRTCRKLPKKVCLMYHIGQCRGPCVIEAARAEYADIVAELTRFLEGRRDTLVRHLARRMRECSAAREYENAQTLLSQMRALSTVPKPAPRAGRAEGVLEELRTALGLPRAPLRIEGFDVSNIQGREPVASMVVFANARPARAEYRIFRIRSVEGIDDYRMMREAVTRRYRRLLDERAPLPDLVLIDGGKGHLSAALEALKALGLADQPVVSIAKEHEHLFTPGRDTPHIFPLDSPLLGLLRHLRDEAHRFAIGHHRRLHRGQAVVSVLDAIPGVGPVTRVRLMKRFGSLKRLKEAPAEEIVSRARVPARTARLITEALHGRT